MKFRLHDRVYRHHPHDGTPKGGHPNRREQWVVVGMFLHWTGARGPSNEIGVQIVPLSQYGSSRPEVLRWEFEWNLSLCDGNLHRRRARVEDRMAKEGIPY